MNKKSDRKTAIALKAMLEGKKLNRKDFGNASLHSWISTIRNQMFIPVESIYTQDRTCDYYILEEEIKRYKDPELRSQQIQEIKADVLRRRQQQALKRLEQVSVISKSNTTITCEDKSVSLEATISSLIGGKSYE
ncbi:hypothetical protein SC738_01535 [Legionella pneumophila serogroup 1]|uniref:hypothetical protein n=1 Tax=Legionella pneumophila TaxID=446 RepID=UPI0007709A3F|nr:hypothetical protein [Legionella pneumophila]HAT8820399.1 hypothetical protein [Legionella pneumophila subsp. pneumophila]MCZ4747098.1 hypothetical protein [Legionella pneumophila]MDO5157299.1 hypothetical protein [Legionella pneumophila]MDO5161455.1 hypothetical protein [Legionella pneumophila]MDO5163529.1 hypothetical protein [Legionella pneumophila]